MLKSIFSGVFSLPLYPPPRPLRFEIVNVIFHLRLDNTDRETRYQGGGLGKFVLKKQVFENCAEKDCVYRF